MSKKIYGTPVTTPMRPEKFGASAEQINAAIEDYFTKKPVKCEVTMEDVQKAIDAAIGDAIGGSY